MRGEDGEIVIDDTGDPLLDKWERELAMGLEPDLEEGLSEEEKQKLAGERNKSKKVRSAATEALVNDDFTQLANDPRYQSKVVAVGSPEDMALLKAATLGRQRGLQGEPDVMGGALRRRGRGR